VLGLSLEVLHGLKLGWYLDVGNETRRLLWRLAHAHGVLLGLVHVAAGLSLAHLRFGERGPNLASRALCAATVLLPGGFFAGGIQVHGGDPGLGILPAPIGGLLLVVSLMIFARAALRGD
jgi:hypothetical protein